MTIQEPQQRLDQDGFVVLPRGTFTPSVPLFLDRGGRVYGEPGSRLDCRFGSGVGMVIGWPRGYVDASHFAGGTYRTGGANQQTYIHARGTPLDLGPLGGWSKVKSLTVNVAVNLNSPSTWTNLVILGVQGDSPPYFGPLPSPYLLYFDNTVLTFAVTTSDGVKRLFRIPSVDVNSPDLKVSVTIDLAGGVVTAVSNDQPTRVSTTDAGTGWGAGLSLANNWMWSFAAGRADPFVSSEGHWGGDLSPWPDMTFTLLSVGGVDGGNNLWGVYNYPGGGRLPYDDSPLPPLFTFSDSRTGTPIQAFAALRGQPTESPDIVVRDVELFGLGGNPNVVIGGVVAGIDFDRFNAEGGTRFVSASGAQVTYPFWMKNCDLAQHTDTHLHLHVTGWLSVRDCKFRYAGRSCANLIGCTGVFENIIDAPPGSATTPMPQEVIFEQRGGSVDYRRCVCDYEYTPGPLALVRMTPEAWAVVATPSIDYPGDPTCARIFDSSVGLRGNQAVPLLYINPRQPGYEAPVSYQIRASDPNDTKVIGVVDSVTDIL